MYFFPGLAKKDWLTESEVSLGSNDLECLRQLESLVESESCRRRHLSELEAQNEMYMRVFARAEQIRSSSQDDELNKQLEACRAELAKYIFINIFHPRHTIRFPLFIYESYT